MFTVMATGTTATYRFATWADVEHFATEQQQIISEDKRTMWDALFPDYPDFTIRNY